MPNMWRRANLGRSFGWLWAAYAVSAYGTGIGFGAFSVVAITVLNAGSAEVAALSASGLATCGSRSGSTRWRSPFRVSVA